MKTLKKYFLVYPLLLLVTGVFAQIEDKGDTRDLLEKTLYNKKRGNLEGAIGYGQLGYVQAIETEDENLIFQFQKVLGDIYLSKRDYNKSVFYYLGIVNNSQKYNIAQHLSEGYFSLANAYSTMGAYEKASHYYGLVNELYERLGDKKGRAKSIEALGKNYSASNQTQKAIDTYERLLDLAISGKQYSYISTAQEKLFTQNILLENTTQAIKHGQAYYDRIKDRGDKAKIAEISDMLAGQYLKGNRNKDALKYSTIANQNAPEKTEYLENFGLAISANNDYNKATNTLNDAVGQYERLRKNKGVARCYNLLAQIAYDHEDYKDATGYLEKAEKIATQRNYRVVALTTYRLAAINYGKRGMSTQQQEYQSLYEATKMQVGNSDKIVSKVSQAKENLAESYEQQAKARLSSQENELLAKEKDALELEKKLKEAELIEHRSKLQETELKQKELEAERIQQDLLLEKQTSEVLTREARLKDFETRAELNKLREAENQKKLELSEKQREVLEQQKAFEEEKANQAKLIQYVIIGAAIAILAILGVAFYRTYNTNRTISEQNQNLAEQQKTILNRNIQLKKSSEAMLAMNNKLKKAHVNLKVLLKKEQETREELENANKEIKKTQVHLVQAEKMSSLGLLTAGIAHEINNPINFVSSGVQSLLQNFQELKSYVENYQKVLALNDFEQIKKYSEILQEDEDAVIDLQTGSEELLEDVNYGVKRITEIVNGLRTFSRHDEAEVKDADINESFGAALLILKNKHKNKAEIVQDLDEKLPLIQCFPGQINQVFVNLINNALDAMDEGGTINILTKDLDADYIEVRIGDNGSGMPDDVKDKIFDPFFTTKDIGKGTGLGLSISHGIIEKHHGSIVVESELGVGTTFIIKLPKKLEVDDKILEEQLM
ncbi:MAG: hypothetical protein JXR07_17765 [Reichenbachiella sp.]